MLLKFWKLWANALGQKYGTDKDANVVASIRTIIVIVTIATNICIVVGINRHWNDAKKPPIVINYIYNSQQNCEVKK